MPQIHGLTNLQALHHNLPPETLAEASVRLGLARRTSDGALAVETGEHTGRSAQDRFLVKDEQTATTVDWGTTNKPMTPDAFNALLADTHTWFENKEVYVVDCLVGASKTHRRKVRVITPSPWHALFAHNMFIPLSGGSKEFTPDITVFHAPQYHADPTRHGCRSGTAIALDLSQGTIVITGTSYAGEIKKSVFSTMNYLMPQEGVLPMHASANIGADGRSAVFFGLSGTGKTTLSADASRRLIGDDEHGWDNDGIFNFEGGCYAKLIRLSETDEPEIHAAVNRPGAIMENVVLSADGTPDFYDDHLTENTRGSYPLAFIPNAAEGGKGGHPSAIIMLTADVFGVLPPISRLTPQQAMYHFISGYTSRLAGTEKGLGKDPQAVFSPCFGGPFMPLHPAEYAQMLGERMKAHHASCWLVNTGWVSGGYEKGHRIALQHTRAMVAAALSGALDDVPTHTDAIFGLHIPGKCPGVPDDILDPTNGWSNPEAYAQRANHLAALFAENFKQFEEKVSQEIRAAGLQPKAAA